MRLLKSLYGPVCDPTVWAYETKGLVSGIFSRRLSEDLFLSSSFSFSVSDKRFLKILFSSLESDKSLFKVSFSCFASDKLFFKESFSSSESDSCVSEVFFSFLSCFVLFFSSCKSSIASLSDFWSFSRAFCSSSRAES